MNDLLPHAMFVSRRALCPGCGAPAPLEGEGAQVTCAYCGTVSRVERRLRTQEPDPGTHEGVPVDWTPSHLLRGDETESARCGACGADLTIARDMAIVSCGRCGASSKVERRLRSEAPRALSGEDAKTVRLIERLATSTDLAERVALAKTSFDSWGSANDTMAGRASELFAILEDADPRLAHAAGEVIGKLLCNKNALQIAAVLAAAERHLFHPKASRVLMWELGLGPGLCLKRLLDAADVHGRHGDLDRAGTALWAANTLIGRNFPDHPTIAAIVLYRLLYLRGPVLGWALRFIRGEGGSSFRHPAPVLLQFLDDCALERPELVPEIRRSFYGNQIENPGDYAARLELFSRLGTSAARATLLRLLPPPPKGTALKTVKAAHELLVGALDDPNLSAAATVALVEQMQGGVPAAIHALVKARKDALPEDLRRAYLKAVPDSPHLAPLPTKYRESEKPEARAPEMVEAERLAGEAIHRAVDLWNQERESLQRYWEIVSERSPLMVAAGRGDLAQIEKLLGEGADRDAQNRYGRTALMFAAESGHAAAVAALGGNRALRDRDGKTAIMLAAEAGHAEAVRALLGDASLDQEAFRVAFERDRPHVLALLLEAGADPDALEEDGSTPLMTCARQGRLDLARTLLDAGAEKDHQDHAGKSPLMHAAEAGQAAAVALLLERGADPDLVTPHEDAALHLAARGGHAAVVERLAGRVRDVNAQGQGGKSALAAAEAAGHTSVVSVLTRRGASLAGDTKLLVEAVKKRDLPRVRALLDAGMTPDVRDERGETVLYCAASTSHPEIFWLLLERGAKPDGELLSRLVVIAWKEAIERVLETGLAPDARRKNGETALMVAAMKGYLEIAEVLLAKGANPRLTDSRGDDAVAFAKMRRDNDAMIRRLEG